MACNEVPVEAHDDLGAGMSRPDLVLLAVEDNMAVAVDLAVDLDCLPGGQGGLAVFPLDRGFGGFGAGLAGAAHGEVGQVLGQQPGRDGAQHVPVQHQVDAVQVGPDGQGPSGQALPDGEGLAASDDDEVPGGRDAGFELDRRAARDRSGGGATTPPPAQGRAICWSGRWAAGRRRRGRGR